MTTAKTHNGPSAQTLLRVSGLAAIGAGLIFAGIGATLMLPSASGENVPVISSAIFGAVVIMVIITTLITPITLKWSLGRKQTSKGKGKSDGK